MVCPSDSRPKYVKKKDPRTMIVSLGLLSCVAVDGILPPKHVHADVLVVTVTVGILKDNVFSGNNIGLPLEGCLFIRL